MRVLAPAVALLLAAAAAWLLLATDPSDEVAATVEREAQEGERYPTLAPGARPVDRATESDARDDPAVAVLDPTLPPWGLEVRLQAGPDESVDGVEVEARLVGPDAQVLWTLAGTTDGDGRCRLGPVDLPDVSRRFGRDVHLEVHAGAGDAHAESWSGRPAAVSRQVRALPAEDVRWLLVTLTLRPGRALRGRLLTATGHPVQGFWVSTRPYTGAERTGWDGGFALRVIPDETILHVGVSGNFEQGWKTAVPALVDPARPVELRLPDERHVSGRVTDAAGRPLEGIHLVLASPDWDPNAGIVLVHHGYRSARHRSRLHARSAPDGTFAFPGLIRGDSYVLWWPGDDDRWHRYERDIHADDTGLEVGVTRHRFTVELIDATSGLAIHGTTEIERVLAEGEYRPLRMFDSAPNEVGTIGAPGDRFHIVAWAPGYAVHESEYVVPVEAGTYAVRLPLRALASAPRVTLRCLDQEGRPLGPVPLVFERFLDGIGRVPLRPLAVQGPEGYVTHELPPGPLHVETTERLGHPSNGPWRFTLDMAADLVIPEKGEASFDLPCRQGGAFRLCVEAPGGEGPSTGPVAVRGPKGEKPNVWWYRPQPGGGWRITMEGDRSWDPGPEALESQAFEAGDWHLRIDGGKAWRDVERSLRLEPGRITEIHVILEPR